MAAEALVSEAYRFMSEKLPDLIQLNDKLKAIDTEGKMEKLKDLSTIIDKVIQYLDSRPFIDDAVKDLLKKLKYLARDLEDVVDHYDTKVLQMQRSNTSFEPVRDIISSDNLFKSRVGCMIKAITESLDFILLQKSILLNLPQDSIRMSELNLYRETHARNSFKVKGRDTEKQTIIDMLTKKDDDDDDDESGHGTIKVIAIVGMGGMGKTTLAQLVFNDEKVKAHFARSRMWKVVGAEFDPKKIMKSVLELATRKQVNISETDLVRQKIEKALSGKKFLLVLDDVWNEDPLKWNVLKAVLTSGARGSKILITTRSQQVSSIMGSSSTTHQIQQLSKDDCLSLFQQFAFGDEVVDQSLMEIGVKIVKKCGGVPLAAISLGSMLRNTRDETYWSSVLKSEMWQLGNAEDKVLAVLKLSYDTLPLQSKKCFAFGSLFPKKYSMAKDKLIKLWIANGFVRSRRRAEGNFEAETVGNRIFDDLVSRSFILMAPVQYDHGVTKCTMHDLMHDLARSVSADAYWNSYQDSVEDIRKRTYHLQIDERKLPDMTQVLGKKPVYLRTFMSLMPLYSFSLSIDLLKVFSELKYLRALDLTDSGIREIPTSIENLIHLRYLNLYHNKIEFLPDSITLLPNLHYLNLAFNYWLRELPKKLVNIQNLRELDLQSTILTHIPCGLSRLTNLRSLPLFIAGDKTGACSILELEDLKLHGKMKMKISNDFENYSRSGRKILKNTDLNELFIEFGASEGYHKDMLDDLCPNTSLKKLEIKNYNSSSQFPTWLKELPLPNLVEVRLTCCCGCEHIPPFGNLQFLKELYLDSMNSITQMGAEFHGSGGFPSLQSLCLSRMDDLEEWSESHDDEQLFPSLQRLRVVSCAKLKSMPRLPRIQELEISYCSGSIVSCIGRLTSLSILRVKEMDDMTSLPSGCIRKLTSLTELKIKSCSQLQSLPGDEFQHLKMIHSLTIEGCPSIILQPEELVQILNSVNEFEIQICGKNVNISGQLQHLHTVKELCLVGAHEFDKIVFGMAKLEICCCDELESLMTSEPANSTVLEQLYIDGFSNLTNLPDWLQHLKSLRSLSVENCPLLEMVPKGLKNLHMLETLKIVGCPQLESRCVRDTGEDWPIISHVRNVYIHSSDSAGEEDEDEDSVDEDGADEDST